MSRDLQEDQAEVVVFKSPECSSGDRGHLGSLGRFPGVNLESTVLSLPPWVLLCGSLNLLHG